MSHTNIPTRKIGDTEVSAIGYGAMGLAAAYGDHLSEEERFEVRGHVQFHLMYSNKAHPGSGHPLRE